MYEQYVLDLLSDVFLGGLPLVSRNPRPLILEIPDLSLWKIRTS